MAHLMPPPPPPIGVSLGTQQGMRPQNINNGAMTLGQMQQPRGLGISPAQLTQPRSSQLQSQPQKSKQEFPKRLELNQYVDVNEPVYEVYVLRRTKAFPDAQPSWRNPPNISMQRVSTSDMAELKKLHRNQYNGKRAPVLRQYDELKHDVMRDAVDQAVEGRNAKEENKKIWQWDLAMIDVKLKPVGNSMFPSRFETTQIRLVLKRVLKPGITPDMAVNAMAIGLSGGSSESKSTVSKPVSKPVKPNPNPQNQQYPPGLQGMLGMPPPPPLLPQMNGMYPPPLQQQQQQHRPQQQQNQPQPLQYQPLPQQYQPQPQQQQQQQQPRPINGQQPMHGAYPQPMMNIPAPPLGQFQPQPPPQQQQPTIQNNINMPAQKKNQNQTANNGQQRNPAVEQKVKKYLEEMPARLIHESDSEDERRRRRGGRRSSQSSPRSSGILDHHRHHEHHRHSTTRRRRSDGSYEYNDSYSSDFDTDEDSAYNTPLSSISDDRHRHYKDKYSYGSPPPLNRSRPRPREDERYMDREVRRKSVYEDYPSPRSERRPSNMVTRVLEYHHGEHPSSVDDLFDPRPLPRTLPLRPAISRSQSTRLPAAPAVPRRVPEQERNARDYVDREKKLAYLAGRRQSQWETLSSEGGYTHGRARQPIPRGALSDMSDSVYVGGRERHWRDEVEDEKEWIRH
jgi:hypothetical protein